MARIRNIDIDNRVLTKKNIILIIIFLLIVVFWKFKGFLIAASVNGQPISKMELSGQLEKKFGSQVLDSIINERLILAATRQKGIFVGDEEINKRIKDIETRLAGKMTMEEALKAQGLTSDDMKKQLEIQLAIEKMFAAESTVSAIEISDYLKKNSQFYKNSTDPAKLKTEVEDLLRQQKLTEAFDKWFVEIRKSAKIQKYI